MLITDGNRATLSPGSLATDRLTTALCRSCAPAVVLDAGRVELAHAMECTADMNRGTRA